MYNGIDVFAIGGHSMFRKTLLLIIILFIAMTQVSCSKEKSLVQQINDAFDMIENNHENDRYLKMDVSVERYFDLPDNTVEPIIINMDTTSAYTMLIDYEEYYLGIQITDYSDIFPHGSHTVIIEENDQLVQLFIDEEGNVTNEHILNSQTYDAEADFSLLTDMKIISITIPEEEEVEYLGDGTYEIVNDYTDFNQSYASLLQAAITSQSLVHYDEATYQILISLTEDGYAIEVHAVYADLKCGYREDFTMLISVSYPDFIDKINYNR